MSDTQSNIPPPDVVALHAEHPVISRQQVAGDTTRVRTVTRERDHEVDETVFHETVEVEHVAVGREVSVTPEIIRDGDLTIIPVVEEILVVTRKLILKEEIHLRRVRHTARHQETITLRTQDAIITRAPPAEKPPETLSNLSTEENET